MNKKKIKLKRPELSFTEVLEQFECTIEDLFEEALRGNLPIYVKAGGWKVGFLCSVKKALVDVVTTSEMNSGNNVIYELMPELGGDVTNFEDGLEAAHKRLAKQIEETDLPEDFNEPFSNGMMTFYPNNGVYRPSYIVPLLGLQPLSKLTIWLYRKGISNLGMYLKLIERYGIPESPTEEFIIFPDPFLDLQEAIANNLLYVMKEDLLRLASNGSVDPEDVKPKGGVTRRSLLKMVIGMAKSAYKFDADKRNDVLASIRAALELKGVGLDDETIRRALNEAAPLSTK